jgi:hypothetical protein
MSNYLILGDVFYMDHAMGMDKLKRSSAPRLSQTKYGWVETRLCFETDDGFAATVGHELGHVVDKRMTLDSFGYGILYKHPRGNGMDYHERVNAGFAAHNALAVSNPGGHARKVGGQLLSRLPTSILIPASSFFYRHAG